MAGGVLSIVSCVSVFSNCVGTIIHVSKIFVLIRDVAIVKIRNIKFVMHSLCALLVECLMYTGIKTLCVTQ